MAEKKKEFKSIFEIDIKSVNEDGTFEGHAAVFGNIDSFGDVIKKGAFKKTIAERKAKKGEARFPVLWNHSSMEPIGSGVVSEDNIGLKFKGRLNMEVPRAVSTRALLKAEDLDGISIGFSTIKEQVKDGIRNLLELKLWEFSPVTFPANELATVTEVRSTEDDPTPEDGAGDMDIEPEVFHSLTRQMKETLTSIKKKGVE